LVAVVYSANFSVFLCTQWIESSKDAALTSHAKGSDIA